MDAPTQTILPGFRPFTRSYRPRPTRDSVVEAAAAVLGQLLWELLRALTL